MSNCKLAVGADVIFADASGFDFLQAANLDLHFLSPFVFVFKLDFSVLFLLSCSIAVMLLLYTACVHLESTNCPQIPLVWGIKPFQNPGLIHACSRIGATV